MASAHGEHFSSAPSARMQHQGGDGILAQRTHTTWTCTLGSTHLVTLQTAGDGAVGTEVRVLKGFAADVALEEFVQALLRGEGRHSRSERGTHSRTYIRQ